MQMSASLITIATLGMVLILIGVKPMSDGGPINASTEPVSKHAQCRIYFGCAPSARTTVGITHPASQEYTR
jgi:hypothetical protein